MIIKELKKVSLSEILIVILLIIILLQRCGGGRTPENPTAPQITRDTVWVHKDSTITNQPQVIKTIPIPVNQWTKEYLPDTNYAKLVKQYMELADKFLDMNIHKDSIRIDTIGIVRITDTVSHNLIKSRTTTYSFKIPTITNTIILPPIPKRQVYVGGFIQGEQGNLINQISVQGLLKNKKDQIYGAHVGINQSGKLQLGVSTYWKIKIKD